MRKIIFLILVSMFFTGTTFARSELPKYLSQSEFEKSAEAKSCQTATDGCNTFFMMEDGKVGGGTRMYCNDTYGANGTEAWSCKKYKEKLEEVRICTMEYAPVCGIDGKTYSNSCMVGGKEKVDYSGKCKQNDVLSVNDRSFYDVIKVRLAEKHQDRVYKVITKYKKITLNMSSEREKLLRIRLLKAIQKKIGGLLLAYPQDIGLPENVNNLHYMLSLLKFEIRLLD